MELLAHPLADPTSTRSDDSRPPGSRRGATRVRTAAPPPAAHRLPPSVARVAARTRLSAELLAAILEVDRRHHATLDDIERADALAERLLVRRGQRLGGGGAGGGVVPTAGAAREGGNGGQGGVPARRRPSTAPLGA